MNAITETQMTPLPDPELARLDFTKLHRGTVEELHEVYGFKDISLDENGKMILNPIYKKWLPVCWIIDGIYGHVEAGHLSQGKARELTAALLEDFSKML